jgi:hypothetical protein
MTAQQNHDASTVLKAEDRIANLDHRPRNEFGALTLYTDTLVINYLGGRVEQIVDWKIVEVDGIDEDEAEYYEPENWVSDQLNGYGDYIDMWAVGTRTICIEDSEGIVFTAELETVETDN